MDGRPRRSRWGQPGPVPARAKSQARQRRGDNWLLILTSILLGFGLIVVYSISPGLAASQGLSQGYFVTKQLLAVVLAVVGFGIATRIPINWWSKSVKYLVWLAVAGSALVMVTPLDANYPAHRWVRLGSFSFQIAELIKLCLIFAAAKFLKDRWSGGELKDSHKTLYPLVAVLGAIGIVVAKLQSDLGSAGVMVVTLGVMAYVVGMPLKRVMTIAGLIAVLLVLAIASSGYRRERLNTFLHPGTDCTGSGYQACQALISVGSGGLMGLGLGYSVQAYGYLPEASNDSIFAIIAEKFGFIGSVLLLFVYGSLLARLKRIAECTTDQFNRLVVVGVLAWLGTQMAINVGAMIGLLPLKGITLPLVSQGGTSIVFLAVALGVVFQISRYTSNKEVEPESVNANTYQTTDNFASRGRDRRSPYPVTFTRPRT